jgi:hypothetical protein
MFQSARTNRVFLVLLVYCCAGGTALAENIDPDSDDSQRAWAENGGWINAEPKGDGGPGVEVGDLELTGWMWGENIGWISLSCQNTASCGTRDYGVSNDGDGGLSGFAWGETVGWISFSCANTASCGTRSYGVSISPSTGEFSGRAWSENAGWITFASSGPTPHKVKTSWTCTDADGDGSCAINDCADGDDRILPGGAQVCDGVNNDCLHPSWPSVVGTNDGDDDLDGLSECQGDCDDSNVTIFRGAPEVNDGLDNQCFGDPGFGIVDEISGTSGFTTPGNNTEFCWDAQGGATLYQIARSTSGDFSKECTTFTTGAACLIDPDVPPTPGGAFHYRVRPLAPFPGSWGKDSSGAEITFVCGTETVCDDGIDDDGDGEIDCADPDCAAVPVCQTSEFTFVDTFADDIPPTALFDFFNGISAGIDDYLLFSIEKPTGISALCTTRADFYQSSYLALAPSGGTAASGLWNKWFLLLQAT